MYCLRCSVERCSEQRLRASQAERRNNMNELINFLYADGDMLMMCCKLVAFIFSVETFAYIVRIIAEVAKCSKS